MSEVYLNENSLTGQFETMEEFWDKIDPFMSSLKYVQQKKWKISKHSEFYKRQITKEMTFHHLRGMGGDKARRLKMLLLGAVDNPPFWDYEEELNQNLEQNYYLWDEDVSATSIAEAAEADSFLLSFPESEYCDKILQVENGNKESIAVPSVTTIPYMGNVLGEKGWIDFKEALMMRYAETRLDFSKLEEGYAFEKFQKDEIRDCIRNFDKFVHMQSWDEIYQDSNFHYKHYTPSSTSFDWFRNSIYQDKVIAKFRCGNPKRCFGYKEGDLFYVLRMERDHRISDNG